MQPTISLPTPFAGLRLRLQAPALTVLRPEQLHSGQAVTCLSPHPNPAHTWQVQAGSVLLHGACRAVSDTLWHLDFHLENRGEETEARVALPYLFYRFEQDLPARMFNPLFGGVLEPSTIPLRIDYPGPASFCLTAAAGLECTLAAGLYNTEQRHAVIRHIPAGVDGQIRFGFERVWVRAGETLSLPTMFISVGPDWPAAFEPYRTWFASHFTRPRSRPDWWETGVFSETRHAHCLVPYHPPAAAAGVWIFDNEGRPRTFEQIQVEIDEILEEGRQQGFQPLFYQFGWWLNMTEIEGLFMFDSLCGDYTQAHDLARQVVEYIHQRGARTYFYTNAISAGDESEVFRLQPGLFARDPAGFPVYNADYPMLMFCPGAPGMRAYWERILRYLLVELDVDGLFLDQVCGGAPPPYCYDPAHRHAHPDTYGRDFLDLIDYIGETARRLKPDCYIGGELVQDTRAILLDEAHGYGYTGPRSSPPAGGEARRCTPPAEYYVFTRYLCPEIYTALKDTPLGLMNGAAGHSANPLWRQNRTIFESSCTPCRVAPRGALAYLYGPKDGAAVLTVRAHGEIGEVEICLPPGLTFSAPLPAGVRESQPGKLICPAGSEPAFYRLSM